MRPNFWPKKERMKNYPSLITILTTMLLISSQDASQDLLKIVKAQDLGNFSRLSVEIEPNLVGSKDADLNISFALDKEIPSGTQIKITLPEDTSVIFKGIEPQISCEVTGFSQFKTLCSSSVDQKSITFPIDEDIIARTSNTYTIKKAFSGPNSSLPTQSFQLEFFDPLENTFASKQTGFILEGLEPAQLKQTSSTQLHSNQVAKHTASLFKMTNELPIPPNGGLRIQFPKWNLQAPTSIQESYVLVSQEGEEEIEVDLSETLISDIENAGSIDFTKLCTKVMNVSSDISCTFHRSSSYDTIIIQGAFPAGLQPNSDIQFIVSPLRNPLTTSPIYLKVTTFAKLTPKSSEEFEPQIQGEIEEGECILQAQILAQIENGSVEADDKTVQEYSIFYISFDVPVPVQQGSIVLIKIPDDFKVDAGQISRVQGWGIFGGTKDLLTEVDEKENTLKIAAQTMEYAAEYTRSTVKITMLKNPDIVRQTATFGVTVLDSDQNGVAEVKSTAKITHMPTPGKIQNIELESLGSDQIQERVTLKLSFKPLHTVMMPQVESQDDQEGTFIDSPDPQLRAFSQRLEIKLPSQIEAECEFISQIFGQSIRAFSGIVCEDIGHNHMRLINPFKNNLNEGGNLIQIEFKGIILPISNIKIQGIQIQTLQEDQTGTFRVIDSIQDPDIILFEPKAVTFLNSEITTGSQEVYSETYFEFSHQLASIVPSDSIINILIPKQITVDDDLEIVTRGCLMRQNLNQNRKKYECRIERDTETGEHLVQIFGAIPTNGLDKLKQITFRLSEGLTTPNSLKSSDSFKIWISTPKEYVINFQYNSLSVTMKEAKPMQDVFLDVTSETVGDLNRHKIHFKAPVPLTNEFIAYIIVPEECELPSMPQITLARSMQSALIDEETESQNTQNSSFQCFGSVNLDPSLECSIIGQKIIVPIKVSYKEGIIPEDKQISLDFGPIRNPRSLLPSSRYQIQIKTTKEYYLVSDSQQNGPRIFISEPAKITNFSLKALDQRQKALTTITIEWVSTQPYPDYLQLHITYDSEQIRPVFPQLNTENTQNDAPLQIDENQTQASDQNDQANDINTKVVPCIFQRSTFVQCDFSQEGLIVVKNILQNQNTIAPGRLMDLTLTNMEFVVTEGPIKTNSWTFTTFLDDEGLYSVDTIQSGLSFEFECSYPCLKCAPGQPNVCLECNSVKSYHILYDNYCYATCPPGTFQEQYECKPCDPKCKTCSETSGIQCTSCHGGDSAFPYLDGNTCTDQCAFGQFGNKETAMCEKCAYPCETCETSANFCLSCMADNVYKYFWQNDCHTQCPTGTVEDVMKRNRICEACNPMCLMCQGTPDTCASCPPGTALNKLDFSCTQTCPPDITVLEVDPLTGLQYCEPCDTSCVTCRGKRDFCTSCQETLSLNASKGKCLLVCDTENFLEVSVDGKCQGCSSSCKTCMELPDNCLSCHPGQFFYMNKCQDECPILDVGLEEFRLKPNEQGVCLLEEFRCPFGQKLINRAGFDTNACEVDLTVCEYPNTLNYDRSKCIPGSQDYLPFPVLIGAGVLSIPPLLSKCTHRQSLLVPNLTIFWSLAEVISMHSLWINAYLFGIRPVLAMVIIAICFHLAINLFFLLVFIKQVKGIDLTFRHWCSYNKCTVAFIQVFGTLVNFQIYRLLYSRLFGRSNFDAAFDDPYTVGKQEDLDDSKVNLIQNQSGKQNGQLNLAKTGGTRRNYASGVFFKPFTLSSILNLLIVKLVCLFAAIFGAYYVNWGYQIYIACLEMLTIDLVLIVLNVIEYLQMRAEVAIQKRTWKVDPKTIDRIAVMGGLQEDYTDSEDSEDAYAYQDRNAGGDQSYNQMMSGRRKNVSQMFAPKKEDKAKALQSIKTMEKVLTQLQQNKRALTLEDLADTQKQISKLHEVEVMKKLQRRCMSFRMERPTFEEAWQFESQDSDIDEPNYISEPNSPRSKEMLLNGNFSWRMAQLQHTYKTRDKYSNCYAEARDPASWPLKNVQMKERAVQTNLLELLGVDDIVAEYSDSDEMGRNTNSPDLYTDNMLDSGVAARLIQGVIDKIDPENFDENQQILLRQLKEQKNLDSLLPKSKIKKGSKAADDDKKKKKKSSAAKRKRLSRKRMAEIPNFEIEDVLGEFERDAMGNLMIIRSKDGRLSDKFGRRVNRRGYLIDQSGNIITRGAVFIFYKEEIDFDDEIPAPYCFQKQIADGKGGQYKVESQSVARKMRRKERQKMQDEFVEKEYQRLKNASKISSTKPRHPSSLSQQAAGMHQKSSNLNENAAIQGKSDRATKNFSGTLKDRSIQQQIAFIGGDLSEKGGLGSQTNQPGMISGIIDQSTIDLNPGHAMSSSMLRESQQSLKGQPMLADDFMAKNSSKMNVKPIQKKKNGTPLSGLPDLGLGTSGNDLDDDAFLNEVIAPLQAKTKEELFGKYSKVNAKNNRARSSSKTKSQQQARDALSEHTTKNSQKSKNLRTKSPMSGRSRKSSTTRRNRSKKSQKLANRPNQTSKSRSRSRSKTNRSFGSSPRSRGADAQNVTNLSQINLKDQQNQNNLQTLQTTNRSHLRQNSSQGAQQLQTTMLGVDNHFQGMGMGMGQGTANEMLTGQNSLENFVFNANPTHQQFVGGRVTYHRQAKENHIQAQGDSNQRSTYLPEPYVHSNMKVYNDEMARLVEKKEMIQQDDQFIRKMDEFNSYINNQRQQMHMDKLKQLGKVNSQDAMILSPRKLEVLHHEMGRLMSRLPGGRQNSSSIKNGKKRDFSGQPLILPDSMHQNLAHKNLGSIYGRVKQKLNKQIRDQGAAVNRIRPQNLRNRLDLPSDHHMIHKQGLSYEQRDQKLQREIDSLINQPLNKSSNVQESTTANQRQGAAPLSISRIPSAQRSTMSGGVSRVGKQSNQRNEKLAEMQRVYSNSRTLTPSQRSQANQNRVYDQSSLLSEYRGILNREDLLLEGNQKAMTREELGDFTINQNVEQQDQEALPQTLEPAAMPVVSGGEEGPNRYDDIQDPQIDFGRQAGEENVVASEKQPRIFYDEKL